MYVLLANVGPARMRAMLLQAAWHLLANRRVYLVLCDRVLIMTETDEI